MEADDNNNNEGDRIRQDCVEENEETATFEHKYDI